MATSAYGDIPTSNPTTAAADMLGRHNELRAAVFVDHEGRLDTIEAGDGDLAAALDPENAGLDYEPLRYPVLTAAGTDPSPCDAVDGVLYGRGQAGDTTKLYRRVAGVWELVAALPGTGSINAVRKLGNGEVIVGRTSGGLYRSTGWTADPVTAAWAQVMVPTAGAWVDNFGLSVHDNLVLVVEYALPREPSRMARLSTDYGATFTDIIDLDVWYPGQAANTHWHGCEIDHWAGATPRLVVSHGDGPQGLFYSDDLGATFQTLAATAQPTTITATPYGLVLGTDETPDGLRRVLRTSDPTQMVVEVMHELKEGYKSGLYGFATRGFRDPDTGTVYVAFRSDTDGVPGFIFASDGRRAVEVYRTPPSAGQPKTRNVAVADGKVWLDVTYDSVISTVVAEEARRGLPPVSLLDEGSVFGGTADRDSVAAGALSSATDRSVAIGSLSSVDDTAIAGAYRGVAVGHGAKAGHGGVVIGFAAVGVQTYATLIGAEATVAGADGATGIGYQALADSNSFAAGRQAKTAAASVAIGFAADALFGSAVSIGPSTKSGGTSAVAIGNGTQALAADGIAIGRTALVNAFAGSGVAIGRAAQCNGGGNRGVALGYNALAGHQDAVALGYASSSTASSQVAFGARHVELVDVTAPATPAAGNGRLYQEAGALKFKGASGTVTTLAPA